VRQQQLPCLLGTLTGTVVIVAAAGRPDAEARVDWEALRAGIMAELDGSRCRMGVGDPCPQPSALPHSLREARLALRLQKASASAARTSVYADLDVLRMLAAVDDLSDVAGFVHKWLGPLAAYDERKHTELVKTLTQYLQHGGGYEATSRALSVHRSTLKYRLQRIRELTGLDLSDPEIHFNLQLATRAHLTLLALGGDGP
jgi:sugar diacid utilization regulator